RPQKQGDQQLLLNATTRGGTDAVFWISEPAKNRWSYSLIGGAHFQQRNDIDKDGWADLPAYQRGVLRPRFFWDDGAGNSVFITTAATIEDRSGGSSSFPEGLLTRRFDGGFARNVPCGKKLIAIRASGMTQGHAHLFGPTLEHERNQTFFGETAVSGSDSKNAWDIGTAIQADTFRSREVGRFNYNYVTPALFAQDEYAVTSRVKVSASGRVDFHNVYGTFFSPRISTLVRLTDQFTARLSTGT